MSRTKRRLLLRFLPTACVIIVVLALDIAVSGPITHIWRKPSRAELDILCGEGELIVRALDAHRVAHGRYPSSLPSSLNTSRAARYGGWRYACSANCTTFGLSAGNYRNYAFEIRWRFASKSWYIDT